MCTVEACIEPLHAKGMCTRHYNRFRDYGNTNLSRKNTKIDWSNPQSCAECAKPMVRSGTKPLSPLQVVHARYGSCIVCVSRTRGGYAPRYAAATRDGLRQCKLCEDFLPLEDYRISNKYVSGIDNACKLCNRLVYTYHIDKKRYIAILEAQNYSCAICLTHVDTLEKDLCIDHDHTCCAYRAKSCGKCVRGLLCVPCNQAIGMLKDNTSALQRAIDYIESNKKD